MDELNNLLLTKACCPCRPTASPQTQGKATRQQAKRINGQTKNNLQIQDK